MPRLLAAPLFLAVLVPAFAEPPEPSDEVKAVLQQLFDAAAKDDKVALQQVVTAVQIPDAGRWIRGTFPGKNGEVVARFLDMAAKSTAAKDSGEFSVLAKKGVTIKEVHSYAAPDKAPAGTAARTLLRLMAKPVPIYSATLAVADPSKEVEFEFPKEGEEKGMPGCEYCKEGNREYLYLHPVRGVATEMNEIVAFDPAPHPDDTRVVLYFVGRTDTLTEESFRKALLDQFARNRPAVEARLKEARAGNAAPGENAKKKADVLEGLLKLEDSMKNGK